VRDFRIDHSKSWPGLKLLSLRHGLRSDLLNLLRTILAVQLSLSTIFAPAFAVAGPQCEALFARSAPEASDSTARVEEIFFSLGQGRGRSAPEATATRQQLEQRSVEILTQLISPRKGDPSPKFRQWFESAINLRRPAELIDALVLLQTLRMDFLRHEFADLRAPAEQKFLELRRQLTGEDVRVMSQAMRRFPRALLREQSREVQAIHDAMFAPNSPQLMGQAWHQLRSYRPGLGDFVGGTLLLAGLFHKSGQDAIAGALHGYVLCSFVEHAIHRYVGHARREVIEQLQALGQRFGALGRIVAEDFRGTAFLHGTVHHGSYAAHYVERFAPREEAGQTAAQRQAQTVERHERMDQLIRNRGASDVESAFRSEYGVSVGWAVRNALIVMPFTTVLSLFSAQAGRMAGFDVGPEFVATSVATSLMFIPVSKFIHPYLHMPREQALASASPLMRWILQTRYVSFIARAHYGHHREVELNQNLVPLADLALGGYRDANLRQVLELIRYRTFF